MSYNPTLDSIAQLNRTFALKLESLGSMIQGMQATGYHKWGFVIYRTIYDDDDAFQRYMAFLQQSLEESLDMAGRKELLLKYHSFIVVDDKKLLDGATKAQVRNHFVAWVEEQNAAGVIPELARVRKERLPRFNHCLVVDKACMQTFIHYGVQTAQGVQLTPRVACAVLDSNWQSPGQGSNDCPPIENCRKFYVGWMYFDAESLLGIYDECSTDDYDDEGILGYKRPPILASGQPGDEVPNVN